MKKIGIITLIGVGLIVVTGNWSCKNSESGEDPYLLTWINCSGSEIDTTTYYVSPSGDNANSGKSPATAFKTLARAFTMIRPGGTIRILAGTYVEGIVLKICGDAALPITIEGYQGFPVMDGQGKIALGLFFTECTNVIVRNLKIQNYTDMGIGLEQSNTILLSVLEVHENGHAVQLLDWNLEGYGIHVAYSENIQVLNNVVYRNGPQPLVAPGYLMGTGINTVGSTNVLIADNVSYQNIGGGITVENSRDVIVERNEIYENNLVAISGDWWEGGIWLDGGGDVAIRENNIHDNLGPGLEISNEDNQWIRGYVLEGNISTTNYYGIYIWNFGTTTWPDTAIIKNIDNNFTGNSVEDVWIEP